MDELREEDFFGPDRKQHRLERKRKSQKDRSKFKKTEHKKYKQSLEREFEQKKKGGGLRRGRVLSVHSEKIEVDCEHTRYLCTVRGLLKREKTEKKNLLVSGDWVLFYPTPEQEGVIEQIEPRKSRLLRADNLARKKQHLIAANIDQVLITTSLLLPSLKPSLIDRYVIAARKGHMEPIVLINKIDLLEKHKERKKIFEELVQLYSEENIPLLPVSAQTGKGLSSLTQQMEGKASVFAGQSGVGKSSLINATTGLSLKTRETVKQTRKGAHTTTKARLIPLPCGGWCIDTPGIKSFGLWDLSKEDLEEHFTEISTLAKSCKYPNCTHTHEAICAVKEALRQDAIRPIRYASYLTLLSSIGDTHLRR